MCLIKGGRNVVSSLPTSMLPCGRCTRAVAPHNGASDGTEPSNETDVSVIRILK